MSRTRTWAVAALLLAAMGCVVPMLGTRSGRPIDPRPIVPGRTTKDELFASAGPPLAIASPGEYVTLSRLPLKHIELRWDEWADLGTASYVQQGDAWFEPFAARRPLHAGHRVYYWSGTTERGAYVWLVLFGIDVRGFREHEVWVLVDEETGIAEDVLHRAR